jgi:hypothetical protein
MSEHDDPQTPLENEPESAEGEELADTELESAAGGFNLGLIGTGGLGVRKNSLRDLGSDFLRTGARRFKKRV